MASRGIKDRVAIVAMGCTCFGEFWDKSAGDLMLEAFEQCLAASPGLDRDRIDAYWLGTLASGWSGLTASKPLQVGYKPVSRVENFCSTGSEAFRNACYAVASGAYDVAVAIGVEKLKDSGFSGLTITYPPSDGSAVELSAPAMFAFLGPAYARKYGLTDQQLRDVLTHLAWKNHQNGAKNPRAQFRKPVKPEVISNSPMIADPLRLFDCSGVADGSAAAVIVRAEEAHRFTDKPIYVKAVSFVAGPGEGLLSPDWDFTCFPEVVCAATDAYRQAGIEKPTAALSLAEVHDCFTPTELILMEDLQFSERGHAWRDVLDGKFDLDGPFPVNPDGGLKSFGHPIGASGLRMLFECWLQLRGEAGPRQLKDPKLALAHNLGGQPGECVCAVSIVGNQLG
jgi:acetyl-CoA C-acetyltransferase